MEKKWSKALRRGGSDAIVMPRESSAPDQTVNGTPSQVGSLVETMVLSSIVLKMEQIVALEEE